MRYIYIPLAILLLSAVLLGPMILIQRAMPSQYAIDEKPGTQLLPLSDGRIRFQEAGAGTSPILLLHGFQGHIGQWDAVWQELGSCESRRIRIDIPGFGHSNWQSRDYSLQAQSERIAKFLDALGIDKVTLAGTSMGGSLAAWFAARYPERVSSLALFAPSGYPGSLSYPGMFGRLITPGKLSSAAARVASSDLYERLFPKSIAVQTLTMTASYGEPWKRLLPAVKAPTFIAWSTGDKTALPFAADLVHKAIEGSALLRLDPATQHSIPNTRPELTGRIICMLSQGSSPHDIAGEPIRELLRPGEVPDR